MGSSRPTARKMALGRPDPLGRLSPRSSGKNAFWSRSVSTSRTRSGRAFRPAAGPSLRLRSRGRTARRRCRCRAAFAHRLVAQQPRDAGQRRQMIGACPEGASSTNTRLTGPSSIASQRDRPFEAREQPVQAIELRQLAVRDSHTPADPGAAKPLAFEQHIVMRRSGRRRSSRHAGQFLESCFLLAARSWAITPCGLSRSAMSMPRSAPPCQAVAHPPPAKLGTPPRRIKPHARGLYSAIIFSRRRAPTRECASPRGIWRPCGGDLDALLEQLDDALVRQRAVGGLAADQQADAQAHRFGRTRARRRAPASAEVKKYFSSNMPRGVAMYLLVVTRLTVLSCMPIASAMSRSTSGRSALHALAERTRPAGARSRARP